MNMKRITAVILAFLLVLTVPLPGCSQPEKPDGKTLSVVCTIFPQYDWVRQILGDKADNFDLTLLLDSGIDLHNYQPTVDDIVKLADCDLLIYVGGESDDWVEYALEQATNKDMIVINLLDVLGSAAKEEEVKVGMEDGGEDGEEGYGDETEYDEHVWLSLKNAEVFCSAIANALSSLDAANAEEYQKNLTEYVAKLSALDAEYKTAVNAAPVTTLLFGDRFPFRYLVDDYGLDYYAVFVGCSAETEASFETVLFHSNKVDELGLNSVMVIEGSDQSIARTIINNTASKDQQIFVLNSLQSVTSNDVQSGVTYLSLMKGNLSVLLKALK